MDRVSNGGRPLALYNPWAAAGLDGPLWANQPPSGGTIDCTEAPAARKSLWPRSKMEIPGFTTRKSDRIFTNHLFISPDQAAQVVFLISGAPFESASQGTIAMPRSTPSF
jgi:hypothetical protein